MDQEQDSSTLSWEWKAKHILTDKFVLKDMGKIMLFAGGGLTLILGGIGVFQGDMETVVNMLMLSGVITGVVVVLAVLVMLIIGGRLRYHFTVDSEGVSFQMLSFARKMNTAVMVGGAMMESMSAVGAGALAKGEEHNRIEFSELTKLRLYPEDKVVFIRGRWNPKPIRLYCPPELYGPVSTRIQEAFDARKSS